MTALTTTTIGSTIYSGGRLFRVVTCFLGPRPRPRWWRWFDVFRTWEESGVSAASAAPVALGVAAAPLRSRVMESWPARARWKRRRFVQSLQQGRER